MPICDNCGDEFDSKRMDVCPDCYEELYEEEFTLDNSEEKVR